MNNQAIAPARQQQDDPTQHQREERRNRRQRRVDLVVHAVACVSEECAYRNCREMKNKLKHWDECQVKVSGGCPVCRRLRVLFRHHGSQCKVKRCKVPKCRAVRECHQSRKLLKRCKTEETFDFCKYFASRPSESDFILLKEKKVMASRKLSPYYYSYTYDRAEKRLSSHKSTLFSKPQKTKDGNMLPALPKELEVKIRAMALQCGDHPIRATQIPPPTDSIKVGDLSEDCWSTTRSHQNCSELSVEEAQRIIEALGVSRHRCSGSFTPAP